MGLLDLQEWNVSPKTNWITYGAKKNSKYNYPSPYLRKIFSIEKPIKNARAYATALGLYQLTINGHLITEDLLRQVILIIISGFNIKLTTLQPS